MTPPKNGFDLSVLKKELKALAESIAYCKNFRIEEAKNTIKATRRKKAKELAIVHLNKVNEECEKLKTDYQYLYAAYSDLRGVPRKKDMANMLDEEVLQSIKNKFIQTPSV
ncbi:MAG: hypothetical protein WCL18_06370 [bacterium]